MPLLQLSATNSSGCATRRLYIEPARRAKQPVDSVYLESCGACRSSLLFVAMKTVVLRVQLPDAVELTEQELEALLLEKLSEHNPPAETVSNDVTSEAVQVPAKDAAEIRHLIGLYYADKATAAMNALWEENGWNAATVEQWLAEKMRSSARKAS